MAYSIIIRENVWVVNRDNGLCSSRKINAHSPKLVSTAPMYSDVMNCWSKAVLPTPWRPSTRTRRGGVADDEVRLCWVTRAPRGLQGETSLSRGSRSGAEAGDGGVTRTIFGEVVGVLPVRPPEAAAAAAARFFLLKESPLLMIPLEEVVKFLTTHTLSAWRICSCSNLAVTASSRGRLSLRALRLLLLLLRGVWPPSPPLISLELLGRCIFFHELERLCGAEWLFVSASGVWRVLRAGGELLPSGCTVDDLLLGDLPPLPSPGLGEGLPLVRRDEGYLQLAVLLGVEDGSATVSWVPNRDSLGTLPLLTSRACCCSASSLAWRAARAKYTSNSSSCNIVPSDFITTEISHHTSAPSPIYLQNKHTLCIRVITICKSKTEDYVHLNFTVDNSIFWFHGKTILYTCEAYISSCRHFINIYLYILNPYILQQLKGTVITTC